MGIANSASMANVDARRAERFDVHFSASLVRHDGTRLPVTVHNVSRYGFMAEGAAMFARGDGVTLRLNDGSSFAATVSWARDDRTGAAFIVPLVSEDLVKLI
jgi:PilZ domain